MFEKASKLKLRFNTDAGTFTAEDLWDLPLTSVGLDLDDLAKDLNRKVEAGSEKSFVCVSSKTDALTELKFDIVKHIIKVKIEEADTAKNAADNKAKKEKIMAFIARKQDKDMEEMEVDDLNKLLAEL